MEESDGERTAGSDTVEDTEERALALSIHNKLPSTCYSGDVDRDHIVIRTCSQGQGARGSGYPDVL
jgi:hypothetical protein